MNKITVGLTIAVLFALFATSCVFAAAPAQEDEESPPGNFVWTMQHYTPGDETLRGVMALDSSHVWAVGHGGSMLFYDGTSWTEQESGTAETLLGITALDAGHVWAVGFVGTVLFYDGTSWTPQESGTSEALHDVTAVDADHVWAVGSGGTVLFEATVSQASTQKHCVRRLIDTVFDGSAEGLVLTLLNEGTVSASESKRIRELIAQARKRKTT